MFVSIKLSYNQIAVVWKQSWHNVTVIFTKFNEAINILANVANFEVKQYLYQKRNINITYLRNKLKLIKKMLTKSELMQRAGKCLNISTVLVFKRLSRSLTLFFNLVLNNSHKSLFCLSYTNVSKKFKSLSFCDVSSTAS